QQLRGAQHPARPPGARHAGHLLRRGRLCAADAHLAGADPRDDRAPAAVPLHRAGSRVPPRPQPSSLADVPPGRGLPGRRARLLRRSEGRALRVPATHDGRRRGAALPRLVLPVHRALCRARLPLPAVRRRGLCDLLAVGMDRGGWLRDDPPRGARELPDRPRALAGLRVRDDARPRRHAPLGHPEHPLAVRGRRASPGAALMRIPLRWLAEWVELPDTAALVERLTQGGLEVESVERIRPALAGGGGARVVGRRPRPTAARLSLCSVDLGDGAALEVVCGAPNVAAGQKVAVATPGTVLPDGTRLAKAKIRGVVSNGMICSAR